MKETYIPKNNQDTHKLTRTPHHYLKKKKKQGGGGLHVPMPPHAQSTIHLIYYYYFLFFLRKDELDTQVQTSYASSIQSKLISAT